MAIEIAPVKKETSLIENLFLILSIIILLISSGAYFYLNSIAVEKRGEADKLSNDLATLAGSDVKAKEETLKTAGIDISDFKILYENNPRVSGFFNSFPTWTHPKVSYSSFSFDVVTRKVAMSGETNGFQNIMQQIALLNKEKESTGGDIESYEISNVNLSEAGSVTFNLDIVVKPEVLK
jgi:hypothetical protein